MPRKGENIYKRKDGRWEGRYIKARKIDGKALYGYVYGRTYRETKEKLSIKLYQISTGRENAQIHPKVKIKTTFKNISEKWLDLKRPQIKTSSLVKYKNLLRLNIWPELGDIPVEELTRPQLEAYCAQLLLNGGKNHTGLAPKTVSDILSIVRNILHFASNMGINLMCDASGITIKQSYRQMHVLSKKEQQKLLSYLCQHLDNKNLGILICLFTGLRIGEICALQWKDINFSEKMLNVNQTMQRIQTDNDPNKKTEIIITAPKSSCSVRQIPLTKELVELLEKCYCGQSGFILTNSTKIYVEPRSMQYRLKNILDAIGINPVNFHTLRHTFATRCVELGFDIKTLSEILGHSSINMTMNRYVHPSMDLKTSNMQLLGSLFAVIQNG